MIDTLILDLDGPILDGKARHHRCYSDILTDHGYAPLPIDTYWEMKRLRRTRREQLAVSQAEAIYDVFLCDWIQRIEKPEYLSLDLVHKGVFEKLSGWKSSGLRVVLATMRRDREQLLRQLQDFGLSTYFTSIIDCRHSEGGVGKAVSVMGKFPEIDPAVSLWIGDTEVDLDAGRYLGCPVCLVACGLREERFLSSIAPELLRPMLRDVDLKALQV